MNYSHPKRACEDCNELFDRDDPVTESWRGVNDLGQWKCPKCALAELKKGLLDLVMGPSLGERG